MLFRSQHCFFGILVNQHNLTILQLTMPPATTAIKKPTGRASKFQYKKLNVAKLLQTIKRAKLVQSLVILNPTVNG